MTCYRDGQRDGNRNRKNQRIEESNQRIEMEESNQRTELKGLTNIIYERICEILKNSTKKMMIQ